MLLDFAQNIQWLLQEWSDRGCLRRVIFASTQLVYATPQNDTPIPIHSPLAPETAYDCHKAEMEFYLSLLAHHKSGVAVDILRLPLLAGPAPIRSIFHTNIFTNGELIISPAAAGPSPPIGPSKKPGAIPGCTWMIWSNS